MLNNPNRYANEDWQQSLPGELQRHLGAHIPVLRAQADTLAGSVPDSETLHLYLGAQRRQVGYEDTADFVYIPVGELTKLALDYRAQGDSGEEVSKLLDNILNGSIAQLQWPAEQGGYPTIIDAIEGMRRTHTLDTRAQARVATETYYGIATLVAVDQALRLQGVSPFSDDMISEMIVRLATAGLYDSEHGRVGVDRLDVFLDNLPRITQIFPALRTDSDEG